MLAFLGFFLVIGAWAVAAPYNGTPDEAHHVVRAAGVAAGQIAVPPEAAVRGGGGYQEVPVSLADVKFCWQHKPSVSAACAPEPSGDKRLVRAATAAGRYHPGYYAIVAGPIALSPDLTGVLLARLISAALCAALLANALTDALRWSRFRLLAGGLVAAFTPMAAHVGGAVNPSGVEIAAGIAFFAAAIPLLYAPGAERSRTLLGHVGVAALALASLRTAGPLWLAVSVVALLLPPQWRRLRQLSQWRALRWWMALVGLACLASVAWTLKFRTNFAENVQFRHFSPGQAAVATLDRWTNLLDEMVGVTAWLDVELPGAIYRVWQFSTASLIVWGFVLATRAGRWRLLALFVGGAILPSALQVYAMNNYGLMTQGRYLLPVLVGLPLLGAFLIQEHGLAADKSAALLRLLVALLLPIHLISLIVTMVRWQRGLPRIPGAGLSSYNPLGGDWQPAYGSVLPLVLSAAGLVIIGWIVCLGRQPVAEGPEDGSAAAAVPAVAEAPAVLPVATVPAVPPVATTEPPPNGAATAQPQQPGTLDRADDSAPGTEQPDTSPTYR